MSYRIELRSKRRIQTSVKRFWRLSLSLRQRKARFKAWIKRPISWLNLKNFRHSFLKTWCTGWAYVAGRLQSKLRAWARKCKVGYQWWLTTECRETAETNSYFYCQLKEAKQSRNRKFEGILQAQCWIASRTTVSRTFENRIFADVICRMSFAASSNRPVGWISIHFPTSRNPRRCRKWRRRGPSIYKVFNWLVKTNHKGRTL